MRLLLGLLTIAAALSFAARAEAVGRMPGHSLQWLGWGYGAGYHAPIQQAHPPVRRAILHAPGGHWLGTGGYGYCHPSQHLMPHPAPLHDHAPAPWSPHGVQMIPVEPAAPSHEHQFPERPPLETLTPDLPPAPHEEEALPEVDVLPLPE